MLFTNGIQNEPNNLPNDLLISRNGGTLMMEKRPRTGWPPVRGKALQGMLMAGVGGPSVSVYHALRGRRTRLRGRQQHERAETYLFSPLG